MIELDDRIMGYSVRDLIMFAEIVTKRGLNDSELKNAMEMYAKGFRDGQEITQTNIEQTMNEFKQNFEIGAWMKSFPFPKIED